MGNTTTPPMRISAGASHGKACSVVWRRARRRSAGLPRGMSAIGVAKRRVPPRRAPSPPAAPGGPGGGGREGRESACFVGLRLDLLEHVIHRLGLDLADE